MKNVSKKISIYQTVIFALLLGAVALRTVALFLDYDPASGYFGAKALINIGNGLLISGVLLSLTSLITLKSGKGFVASFDTAATYIPSGVVAAALAFIGAHLFRNIVKLPEKLLSKESLTDVKVLFMLALSALAVIAVGAFLLNALSTKRSDASRAGFYVAAVVFLMLYSAYLYFSTRLPINAPTKTVDQMAYMVSAIFFLYETRISLDRPVWHAYVAFGMSAALLTAYSALPSLVYYFAKGVMISDSIYECVLTLALFIFICARLILLTELQSDEHCPAARLAEIQAENRSAARLAREEALACANNDNEENVEDGEPSNYSMDIDDTATDSTEVTE